MFSSHPWRTLVASVTLTVFVAWPLAPDEARAGEDDTSGSLTTWTVTEGADAVGTERLRVVHSDSGAVFASGELKIERGAHKGHRMTHLQRGADGRLLKYRRVEAGRKGKGVFAFARNDRLRVVGVNTGAKPADRADMLGRYLWDPLVWSHLAVLAPRLDEAKPSVEVAYFDVATRKGGTATFTRQAPSRVLDAKGQPVQVLTWALERGPGAPLTVYVGPRRRLVGVKGAGRAMLLEGWRWHAGEPAPAAATKAAGRAEASKGSDGGGAAGDKVTPDDEEGP